MSVEAGDGTGRLDLAADDFQSYLNTLLHDWLKTLVTLACALVPAFFILDLFTMPATLLPRFGLYRLFLALALALQLLLIRHTAPSDKSHFHGYLATVTIGGVIAMMTVHLGGFDSSYYAGLNLVIMGVNLLLPWRAVHSAVNSGLVIAIYLYLNLAGRVEFETVNLINNLFFMFATAIIAFFINHLRYNQVKNEFALRIELREARDALWSEMEIAKRIQTALLPEKVEMHGLELAARMIPAREVGGDYYDLLETPDGQGWVVIGDVSGHGVDSGLIMMMAQTSVQAMIKNSPRAGPSEILAGVNKVLRENISRLGSDHYMTMTAVRLDPMGLTISGKHQDLIIHRGRKGGCETIPTKGTWLGIADDIGAYLEDQRIGLESGDTLLLFTDGITEAVGPGDGMFGQDRLAEALNRKAGSPVEMILDEILKEVDDFQEEQDDDMTLMVIRRFPQTPQGRVPAG